MKLLLRNGHVIDPTTGTDSVVDILIVDGTIEKMKSGIAPPKDAHVEDMSGKVIAPGFIDMHVHLREPGFEHKETIETGLLAAASGGFTAVCCMPNTNPAIDDASVVRRIIERGRSVHGGMIDVYPVAAVSKNREGKELAPMKELAHAGAVAFSDDGAPVLDSELMRRALEYSDMLGKPIIQHAEDTCMTKGGAMNEGLVSTSLGLPAMPAVAEDTMIARDLLLAKFTSAQYHVAHMSTAGAVELLRQAKREGLRVSGEVTPHHFVLSDEAVRMYDTNTKMNPPLRTRDDIEAMKEGLKDGTIDVIATDHAPHSYDEKQVEYQHAPFGIVGLETAIGLAITHLVESGVLSLATLIEKFSTNPRRILHLQPVRIAVGEPANLTLFDPKIQWVVDIQQFRSKSRNSPFNGWKLTGKSIGICNHAGFFRSLPASS